MARNNTRIIFTLFMMFLLAVELSDARRGGGFRSSSRSTRRGTMPRRTTDYRSRFGSSISTSRSKISSIGWKKALIAGGLLYLGSRLYMSRRLYYSHPHRSPTICSNYIDADENGTIYRMFICPRHYEDDTFSRCCGPEGAQTCCKRYTSGHGSTVGAVIGAIIFVAIIGAIIYCVCRKKRNNGQVLSKGQDQGVILVPPPQQMPPPQPMPNMGPPPMGYGPQPMMPPPGMDPNAVNYSMNYGSTFGPQQQQFPPQDFAKYPGPAPGGPMPGQMPPSPYGHDPALHPNPSAPPGTQPAPAPPGFYMPQPNQPPPPYAMP